MVRTIVIGVIILSMLGACKKDAPTSDIDKAAGLFFLLVKQGEFDRIYSESAPQFKEQQSHAAVVDKLQEVVKYGLPQEWHRLSMQFGDEDKVHVALPVYIVRTDKMDVEVSLKFADVDGVWRLMGFLASPHVPNR